MNVEIEKFYAEKGIGLWFPENIEKVLASVLANNRIIPWSSTGDPLD